MPKRSPLKRAALVIPRWVSITPLGAPVVPDVKTSWATSSGSGGGSGTSSPAPALTRSGQSCKGNQLTQRRAGAGPSSANDRRQIVAAMFGREDHAGRTGRAQDVLDLAGTGQRVDRHQDEPCHRRGERQAGRTGSCSARARRCRSPGLEPRRKRTGDGLGFGAAPRRRCGAFACRVGRAGHQRDAIRRPCGGVAQDARDRRIANRLVSRRPVGLAQGCWARYASSVAWKWRMRLSW